MTALTCHKTDDSQGWPGAELGADAAERIARAFAQVLGAERVVVGNDARLASRPLAAAVKAGLVKAGVEVLDIGLSGTEEMYHATDYFGADGGIAVTASHSPTDYDGLKLVKHGATLMDPATDIPAISALAESGDFAQVKPGGNIRPAKAARGAYVRAVLSFVDVAALRPMKILVNAGNGAAGPSFDAIAEGLAKRRAPLSFICLNHEPDDSCVTSPLLAANRAMTANAVRAAGADMGIAWDGDFGCCFLFDNLGRLVSGNYVVGLLAEVFLGKEPGARIVHDPHMIWNTQEIVARLGGEAIMVRTGQTSMKRAMHDSGAAYGGATSSHHYFRDFAGCDSGMIPWLLIVELMSRRGVTLADLLSNRMAAFPSSGEIRFQVNDAGAALARVDAALKGEAITRDDTDGLSLDLGTWRLCLRRPDTNSALRLYVESHGDAALVAASVDRVRRLISGLA